MRTRGVSQAGLTRMARAGHLCADKGADPGGQIDEAGGVGSGGP